MKEKGKNGARKVKEVGRRDSNRSLVTRCKPKNLIEILSLKWLGLMV